MQRGMPEKDIASEIEEAELGTGEKPMPRGVYERKPRSATAAQAAPKPNGTGKRRGRPPKAANGSYAALLASLRAERERLVDKVAAIGTTIEALEGIEA